MVIAPIPIAVSCSPTSAVLGLKLPVSRLFFHVHTLRGGCCTSDLRPPGPPNEKDAAFRTSRVVATGNVQSLINSLGCRLLSVNSMT